MTIERLLQKLRKRDEVSDEEEKILREIIEPPRSVAPRQYLIREGEPLTRSTLLIEGIMGRYKDMRDGQRQIMELHVAGDFADLHGFTLKRLDHDVMTMTECRVSSAPHDALNYITEHYPRLTRLLWFTTNVDAAIHRVWTASLGRRDAIARLAHLVCELQQRLQLVGLASASEYGLPLTQADLAECLGLTPVHVNRVLKELRERELMTFRSGRVTIYDLPKLKRLAEFSSDYLYLDRRSS